MKIESDVTVMLTEEEIDEIIKFHLLYTRVLDSAFELDAKYKVGESIAYTFRKSES
jgi:hypothetical protein